jgi:hypothetical protein
MPRMRPDWGRQLQEQLQELRALTQAFAQGQLVIARSISVKLRMLLRGSSGDKALLLQVWPDIRLAPLRVSPRRDAPSDHITLPSKTIIDQNIVLEAGAAVKNLYAQGAPWRLRIDSPLDLSRPWLPLEEWGDQALLRPTWTLTNLIECVAHSDGGAHIKWDDRIESLQHWGFLHWHLINRMALDLAQQIERESRRLSRP